MNATYPTIGSLALKPHRAEPRLRVVDGTPQDRESPFDALAMQVFGPLHGVDFPSMVHDVLDGKLSCIPAMRPAEGAFAVASSLVATCALFLLSFM